MSSDLCLRLPQLLPRHRREVVLLVVGCVALPHDEDDLQPLRAQRPECPAMRMPPPPLLVVVRPGPLTRPEREERDLIAHVPQRLVAGDAEVHDPLLLPAPLGHRHGSSLGLEMPKRDRKSTRLNSSHSQISYAVFCLKKKNSEITINC